MEAYADAERDFKAGMIAQAGQCPFEFQLLCEQSGRVRMFLPMKTVGQLFG